MLLYDALKSSTYKFALACIAIFGTAVLVLFGFVYFSTIAFVHGSLDQALTADAGVIRSTFDRTGLAAATAILKERVEENESTGGRYLLVGPAGAPLAGNLPGWPDGVASVDGPTTFTPATGAPIRAMRAIFPGGHRLLVGRSEMGLEQFARRIRLAFLLMIAFIFLLATVASLAVTRRTVGRIDAINATTRAIMRSGLGERIPQRGTHDEWDALAANLNAMLDRIETLVGEVKEVSDNVAHDLRTPLARIRGRLEQASDAQRNPDRDQVMIARTLSDLDDVLRLFASLTRISRIEAGSATFSAAPVNLFKVARDVADLFDAASEQNDGSLEVAGDRSVAIRGDRDLLFDAIANLVDNAIKHGRRGGAVLIEIAATRENATVTVSDDGPGIPAGEYGHVLRRFYRRESSRHTPGNGLGLSLVSAVARFHGGEFEMADNQPGLVARLRLPVTIAPSNADRASVPNTPNAVATT